MSIHSEEDERTLDRQKLRTSCKRKAAEDPCEKPAKVIISQVEKDCALLPKDVIAVRQAIYRQQRKTMSILPKSLLETIETLQDFDLQSVNDEKMLHVVDADSQIVMFSTAPNLELMCQGVH